MKKYFSILTAVILAALTMSLTACGDDNDEPSVNPGGNGTITIKHTGYSADTYYQHSAYWCYYESSDKTSFMAILKENKDDMTPSCELHFKIRGNVKNLTTLKLENIYVEPLFQNISQLETSPHNQIGGEVRVKSSNGDKVTLVFKDVEYGNSTLNGEITYAFEQYL